MHGVSVCARACAVTAACKKQLIPGEFEARGLVVPEEPEEGGLLGVAAGPTHQERSVAVIP